MVSLGFWSAVIILGLALIATGRAQRDRFWLIFGTLLIAVSAAVAVTGGVAPRLILGPNSALATLGAFIIAAIFAVHSPLLPRRLAARFGFGLRDRTADFDRSLSSERHLLLEAWRAAAALPDGERDLGTAKAHLRRIRTLSAPDPAWRAFRDDLADLDERCINQLERLPDEPDLPPAYGGFLERWERLRAAYRADPSAVRKRAAWTGSIWALAFATGVGLVGLGELHVVGNSPFVLSIPADVPAIIILSFAVTFFLSIFVPALRRRLT